jgi:toxin ParE1/3/4
MKIKLTLYAQADLRRIASRITQANPAAARAWLRKVRDRIRLAGRSPHAGRKVPELDRDDLPEAIVGNYRVVYAVLPRSVEVRRVFEGHRLLPDLDG